MNPETNTIDLNRQEAIAAHYEAEAAKAKQIPNKIDSIDLQFYKRLHEEAAKTRAELEQLQKQLQQQESKSIYASGAVSSFSEYIENKYSLSKDDTVDSETGDIKRAS